MFILVRGVAQSLGVVRGESNHMAPGRIPEVWTNFRSEQAAERSHVYPLRAFPQKMFQRRLEAMDLPMTCEACRTCVQTAKRA